MLGKPPLPSALAENKATFEELMEYRSNSQQIRSKFFTNGRSDFKIVAQLLSIFHAKQRLTHILSSADPDLEALELLLSNSPCFNDSYTEADLSSEILDETFQSPLHLAVHGN